MGGFTYEADIWHTELVAKQFGFEKSKVVVTPWVQELEDAEKEELLDNEHHQKFQSLIAR